MHKEFSYLREHSELEIDARPFPSLNPPVCLELLEASALALEPMLLSRNSGSVFCSAEHLKLDSPAQVFQVGCMHLRVYAKS